MSVNCSRCGHDRDDPRRRGSHPDDFGTKFCIKGCGCACVFPPAPEDCSICNDPATHSMPVAHVHNKMMAELSAAAPEQMAELADKINANVERMERSQRVSPEVMNLHIDPTVAPQPAELPDHLLEMRRRDDLCRRLVQLIISRNAELNDLRELKTRYICGKATKEEVAARVPAPSDRPAGEQARLAAEKAAKMCLQEVERMEGRVLWTKARQSTIAAIILESFSAPVPAQEQEVDSGEEHGTDCPVWSAECTCGRV